MSSNVQMLGEMRNQIKHEVGKYVMGPQVFVKFASARGNDSVKFDSQTGQDEANEDQKVNDVAENLNQAQARENVNVQRARQRDEEENKEVRPTRPVDNPQEEVKAVGHEVQAAAIRRDDFRPAAVAENNRVAARPAGPQQPREEVKETDEVIDRLTRKMCDRKRLVRVDQRQRAAVKRETGGALGASRNKMKSVDLTKKKVIFQ